MRNGMIALAMLGLLGAHLAPAAAAQDPAPPAVYVIFDASGSMWGQLPDRSHKVVVAKEVVQDFVAQDFGDAELALRAYGHRRKGDCRDSELVVPFGPPEAAAAQVRAFMRTLNPLGKTPITYSLRQALDDFGDRQGEIILITDGLETCDDDPCALVQAWRDRDVQVNVHVVGFGLEEKEKTALQCIAEAAGTDYHDAGSALELATELAEIQEATLPASTEGGGDVQRTRTVGFWLQGVDADGRPIRVHGRLLQDTIERFEVSSHRRNRVEAGTYDLVAGVRTANGHLYRPVTRTVTTTDTADTVVTVEVPVPPSVRATFTEADEEQRGSLVRAYQDGTEVFTFRWLDEVFVDEGSYEFRARPNADNDLSVAESFAAGDHKEIVFEMVPTVAVTFGMVAAGSAIPFRENFELWQNGDRKYQVHNRNGATIRPGIYDVHLDSDLNPHVEPGVAVSGEDGQHIEITVPVGHVTFRYQKADGTPEEDKRVFLARGPEARGRVKQSGQRYPLIPGTYNVEGWRGAYDKIVFEVKAGDEKDVVLRARE